MKTTVILLSATLLWTACGNSKPTGQMVKEPAIENIVSISNAQLKNVEISTGKLEARNISSIIKVNGKIDVPPQNVVSVSVPLGGYLKSTRLLPGMHVNKGEVIANMEDQQYIQLQQDYLLAKSKAHFADLEYTRQRELNQSQASSDKVTQQAQLQANEQHIMVNALAEKLRLINIEPQSLSAGKISKSINIYSKINGFVSKVNVNIGKYVNPSEVLFELVDPTDIHLNLKVYEKDIPSLYIGQKLFAYSNTEPNKKHAGEIILISKDISADGITEVHCHFETYDRSLLPGMYMNAEVETKNNRANTLAEAAIVSFKGKDYVFIANGNNQFTMKPVTTGAKENGFVIILNDGELTNKDIVIKGAYTLLMKLKNKEEQ